MRQTGACLRAFVKDRSGAISSLMLVFLIGILLTTGIALDLLRNEAARADLQAAMDRGVLAAASMSQQEDIEAVVRSYVESGVSFGTEVQIDVTPNIDANTREITATASYRSDSIFMSLLGYPTLMVPASATAVEGRSNIEISLILDTSGSMSPSSKIGNLRTAATDFLDIVEEGYGDGRVVVNLIPFSDNVDTGSEVFDFLGVARTANTGNCAVFQMDDFTGIHPPAHGAMFQRPRDWCETNNVRMAYLSDDFDHLRTRVGSLQAVGWTNTYTAMKWAVTLLNPAIRTDEIYPVADPSVPGGTEDVSFVDGLIGMGLVDSQFAGLPADWEDDATLKVIIVMTDGNINPTADMDGQWVMTWEEAETNFELQCDLARDQDVLVYTIAFEAPQTAQEQMAACATTESTFFDVNGTDLVEAFRQIAEQITTLKLTK